MSQPHGAAKARIAVSAGSALATRLYEQSRAARWELTVDEFCTALDASVGHAFAGKEPAPEAVDRYASSLHVEDLALASACAAGQEAAWDHFVLTHRPALYRAADAIDPTGATRDLADALYADLFGLTEQDGARRSLFRYFHGRSSLATWLRAVLAQRHIDRVRAGRRLDPLPDDDSPMLESTVAGKTSDAALDPERSRYVDAMRDALVVSIAALAPRDRLRLASYYAQDLTLAEIGRLLGEHEGTVSRHLTRTRHAIRQMVEERLHAEHGLDASSIADCFRSITDDPGSLDLAELIAPDPTPLETAGPGPQRRAGRKNADQDRSR